MIHGLYGYTCSKIFHVSMSNSPKISIITVVYNAEKLLGDTLQSMLHQTFADWECIVVDGCSTDSTLDIARQLNDGRLRIYSAPDKGIYDAMNKGIQYAKGEYLLFLNAGDLLYADDTLSRIIALAPNADVIYGNTAIINQSGEIIGERRLSPPEHLTWKSLRYGMCVSHQSILVRRAVAPEYNLNYRISGDIDWTIRVLKQSKSIVNAHQYISKFLEGGVSTARRKEGLKERFIIQTRHYGWLTTLVSHVYITLRFVKHLFTKQSMT